MRMTHETSSGLPGNCAGGCHEVKVGNGREGVDAPHSGRLSQLGQVEVPCASFPPGSSGTTGAGHGPTEPKAFRNPDHGARGVDSGLPFSLTLSQRAP